MIAAVRSQRRLDAGEIAARGVVAGLFLGLAYRVGLEVLETGRMSGLLLLTSELLVVGLTLARRRASVVNRGLEARVVAGVSIAGPFLLQPDSTAALVPELVVLVCSGAGLFVAIAGKVSLGRSLGSTASE